MIVLKGILKVLSLIATLTAFISNIYLFTYPSLHPARCSWKGSHPTDISSSFIPLNPISKWSFYSLRYLKDVIHTITAVVPFWDRENQVRLLALGDPQIIGIHPDMSYYTSLDTYGNDYFLGHLYQVMMKRLHPTHVAVLGDLVSSQWIPDSEFYNRTKRYATRIFRRDLTPIENSLNRSHDSWNRYVSPVDEWMANFFKIWKNDSKPFEFGYSDLYSWDHKREDFLFLNLTGNHDIGYAGDVDYDLLARYNDLFGKDNFWIEYNKGTPKAWRIVVLNSLLLDGPSLHNTLKNSTWEFLYQLFERRFDGSTVLLTHVPFYKRSGLCVDGPNFEYYDDDSECLSQQNHLSKETTDRVLNLVFDNDKKPGIILNGHDHQGCETYYNLESMSGTWTAESTPDNSVYHIKEATVKSMMGQFGGNAGLVTGDFNEKEQKWNWEYTLCPHTREHPWWIAKVSTLIAGGLWSLYVLI